jgi:hypothetical protein
LRPQARERAFGHRDLQLIGLSAAGCRPGAAGLAPTRESSDVRVRALVNDQTSAASSTLYSALLIAFLAHLVNTAKKMLARLKSRNMLRGGN